MDTGIYPRWYQPLTFSCREIGKTKGCDRIYAYSVCRVSFDRRENTYIVKSYNAGHECHVGNWTSIVGHVKFESNVYIEEKDYLNNFEKMVILFYNLKMVVFICLGIELLIRTLFIVM